MGKLQKNCRFTENYENRIHEKWNQQRFHRNQTLHVAGGEIIFCCEGKPSKKLKSGEIYEILSCLKHTVKWLTLELNLIDSLEIIF